MSRGKQLQEMEVGTKQSKTAVNSGSKAGDSMQTLAPGAVEGQTGNWVDLGGPTPENYTNDENGPAKLNIPSKTLKQVKDVVNRGAKSADPMKGLNKSGAVTEEEEIDSQDLIDEEENLDDEELLEASEKDDDEDEEGDEEEDDDEDEEEEDNGKNVRKKMKEQVEDDEEEDDEEEEEEFDIEEDVTALLDGEDLSEQFQEKARTIFESALRSKILNIKETLISQYDEAYELRLIEEVQEIKSALNERVDSYLEYVAEEWITENQLSVENGLKSEMTESFLSGMKELFETHYVSIPEDKYNVLESMVEKLDDMETKLNEQIEKNITLNSRLAESVAEGIFDNVSEGLALSQKEKLASLAEGVEFESGQKYREKLEMLKESYFSAQKTPKVRTESLLEEVEYNSAGVTSEYMNSYLKTLSVVAKR